MKKNQGLCFRLTKSEKESIAIQAKRNGLSITAYLLQAHYKLTASQVVCPLCGCKPSELPVNTTEQAIAESI